MDNTEPTVVSGETETAPEVVSSAPSQAPSPKPKKRKVAAPQAKPASPHPFGIRVIDN